MFRPPVSSMVYQITLKRCKRPCGLVGVEFRCCFRADKSIKVKINDFWLQNGPQAAGTQKKTFWLFDKGTWFLGLYARTQSVFFDFRPVGRHMRLATCLFRLFLDKTSNTRSKIIIFGLKMLIFHQSPKIGWWAAFDLVVNFWSMRLGKWVRKHILGTW